MRRFILFFSLVVALTCSIVSWAASDNVLLSSTEVSLQDTRSLQNGAKLFVNYCLSCHSAKYLRYERLVEDLNIPRKLVISEMLPAGVKLGSPMLTTMTVKDGQDWFGVAPPDLTLVAKLRGTDWFYSYLKSFYWDENTTTGWNNTILENVAMPNVLYQLQGIQKPVFKTQTDRYGKDHEVVDKMMTIKQGQLSSKEFDKAVHDLTNFLYYAGEPSKMVSVKYGLWTMFFLGLLIFMTYFLKKEYWKDID